MPGGPDRDGSGPPHDHGRGSGDGNSPPPPPPFGRPEPTGFVPQGAGQEAFAFEARLGEVLLELKGTDVEDLVYSTASKPVDFENWVTLTRMNLESKHSQLVIWWDSMYSSARNAYEQYLQLSPLQRSDIRPDLSGFNVTGHQVERYMRRHVIKAMPRHIQNTLLHMHNVSCADVLFQAMVDAGPGTEQDRSFTLQSVVTKGQAPPVHLIYDKLHKWRFDMSRLTALGVHPPDPGVQRNVIIHYVTKLAEADRNFEYRLNAYRLTRHVQGAVTQPTVDELWRYLVAEAREVHGVGQTSAKKAAAKSQSKQPQQQSAPHNVPEGAGDVPKDTAKKVDPQPKAKAKAKARAKSKGAGKGKNSEKKTAKNDDVEDSKDGSSSGKGAGKRRPCTFFNNGQGCKNGALCEFKHKERTPKDGQCFNCGSKSHTKPDCPAPKKDGKQAGAGTKSDSDGQPGELYERILETLEDDADTDNEYHPNSAKLCHEPEKKLSAHGFVPKGAGCVECVRASRRRKANIPKGVEPDSEEKSAGRRARDAATSENLGRLVLIDSGCSCETQPFPASWNGVPPKHAELTALFLAVGKIPGYKIGEVVYVSEEHGEMEPVFPWGRYSRKWLLTADLNYHSADPHILHEPSGLKFPVIWKGNLPHIYERQIEQLRFADRMRQFKVK